MTDESGSSPLQFEFESDGEKDLVKAIDDVEKSLGKLQETQKRGAGMEADLRQQSAAASRKAAADMKAFLDASSRLPRSANDNAKALEGMRNASSALRPQLEQLKRGLSGVGQAIGLVSPEARGAIGAISGLTGSIGSSTSRLGLWGAALGIVTSGIGYMANGIAEADAEAQKWTDRLNDRTIPTLEELIRKINQANAAMSLQQQRDMNVAGPTDALARQNQAAAQLADALSQRQRARAAAQGGGDYSLHEAVDRAEAAVVRARSAAAEASAQYAEAQSIEVAIQNEENLNRAGLNPDGTPMTRQQRVLLGLEAEPAQRGGRGGRRAVQTGYLGIDGRGGTSYEDTELSDALRRGVSQSADDKGGNEVTMASERARADFEDRAEAERGLRELERGMRDQALEEERTRQAEYLRLWEQGASAALTASRALFTGDKAMRKERLKSMAEEELFLGIAATAIAVGNTIFNPPGAATKYAEAGLHFGLAATYGIGSAATPSSGGAGGSDKSARARPDVPGPVGGAGGGGDLVFNLNAPALVTNGALAELGRHVSGMMRESADVFGDDYIGGRRAA